ncbi:hypothetical protein [Actinomadura sp. GTD37]|uniref:hypothetical protein n=1 Tax=Actinomadura sp. GTD37 TaxID=1778030 RepID=UPI0035BF32ED
MTSIAGPEKRTAIIQGYRDLLDYLENHPEIPINEYYNEVSVSINDGTDQEERAEVDRIAAALGVTATGDSHYRARRAFGPVEYKAAAITRAWMSQRDAAESYRSNIQLDSAEAETAGAGR